MKKLYRFAVSLKAEGFVYAESEKEALGILDASRNRIEDEAEFFCDEIEKSSDISGYEENYLPYGTDMDISQCKAEQERAEVKADAESDYFI